MKKMLFLWLLLQPCFLLAWQGDVSYFSFDDGILRLDAPAQADTAYLSTPLRAAINAHWEATVQMEYLPSSSNLVRVYLMADTTCLTTLLNGYYVQIGGAKKTISLHRQEGAKHTLLLTAPDDVLLQAPVQVSIKVSRSDAFEWNVHYALDKGVWVSMTSVVDVVMTQNKAWGMWCKYTKTRNKAFTFSALSATGDICAVLPVKPVDNVYITEVLYDPYPSGVDFVELYNASVDAIDLSSCVLSNGKKAVKLPVYSLQPAAYVALTLSDSILLEQYPDACYENFLQVPSMPNFVNDSGAVCLRCNGLLVDSMQYNDAMHHVQLHNAEGFSLERVPFDGENWFSASSDVQATPGCSNSQATILPPNDTIADEPFWLSDSWFAPNQQYLTIYHRVEEGSIANAWVYNLQGVPVYRIYNNTLLSAGGSTYWDGRDDAGQPCSVGIYIIAIEWITLSNRINRIKIPVALGK